MATQSINRRRHAALFRLVYAGAGKAFISIGGRFLAIGGAYLVVEVA